MTSVSNLSKTSFIGKIRPARIIYGTSSRNKGVNITGNTRVAFLSDFEELRASNPDISTRSFLYHYLQRDVLLELIRCVWLNCATWELDPWAKKKKKKNSKVKN